ncbi:uncharacterized protein LOC131614867 [Vicia villosa]|uniref:uncharacterized protein LOC131614867 n=1 Tax=Vicia villosa TaxID=3911 RepID=UPI00273B5083|nr:uncharacterized protein LOC131614867 [Vicia villosa]
MTQSDHAGTGNHSGDIPPIPLSSKNKEDVRFCSRPVQSQTIKLRIHHMGELVDHPAKWYVNGLVSEMDWLWDTDYMSYMQFEKLIRKEGYRNIKCMWYWNPKYSFGRGLRPLNCDGDVLKLIEDLKGFDLVDVYVEHTVEVLGDEDIVNHYDEDGGPNYAEDEVDSDVEVVKDDDMTKNAYASDNEMDVNEADRGDVDTEHVETEHVDVGMEDDEEDEDYVADTEIGSLSDEDLECSDDYVEQTEDLDWTSVMQCDEDHDKAKKSDEDDDSDVLHTPDGSGNDEEHEKFPSYKSGESSKFELCMVFSNKEMVKDVVKDYGMENNKNVVIKKNEAKRMVIKCMEGCNFHMRVSKRVGNQYWQVVSLIDEHNCARTPYNRQAKTNWLAKKFGHILRHNPDMKPAGLIDQALDRWGVKLSHDQAYRAKRRAMDMLQGAGMEQFQHLRRYAQELLKSNPNSTVVIRCADSNEGPVFERIYVGLEACKYGFAKFCRPLIGLDACFLKGDFGGQLMAAVGRDGNNKIMPIAYAVVEAETRDSWDWFIKLLLEDLEAINQRAYAFISDQQKGLIPAIQSVSAHVEQRICVKHLYGNWKKKNPGLEFKEVMWSAARATTVPSWERAMLKMKGMKETAWKEMVDVPATYWSRAHFNTYSKCDLQVNNMCEAFNRAILEYRDKPIITLLEGIKHYLTKRIAKMKDLMNTYSGDICPRIQMVLEKNKRNAAHWTPTWHGDDDMAIYGVTNGVDTYVVNLKQETCACRKWDLTGIPCSHSITCIWQNKKKPEDYKDTFKNIYSHIIYPTNGPQLRPLDNQSTMNPPIMRRAIGCPKKMRNKDNDEPRLKHVLPRKLATVTCHKCGGMGHNKRSCKGKTTADRAIPKGGNKKKIAGGQKKKTKPNEEDIGNSSQAPMILFKAVMFNAIMVNYGICISCQLCTDVIWSNYVQILFKVTGPKFEH